jgi:hypothetical protein
VINKVLHQNKIKKKKKKKKRAKRSSRWKSKFLLGNIDILRSNPNPAKKKKRNALFLLSASPTIPLQWSHNITMNQEHKNG